MTLLCNPHTGYSTLSEGHSGIPVNMLQQKLWEKNLYSGEIDGHYKTETVEAVKAFQAQNNLIPDGIADPATLHLLFKEELPTEN